MYVMYKGQIICIIIIFVIGTLYFTSERKRTESFKWFSAFLITSFTQILFDIGSVYTVNHLESVSGFLNRLVHCFYMGLMLLLFYIVYKYLEVLIQEEKGENISKLKYSVVPLILAILGVIFLPLYYMETPKGNYSYGPAALMIYISVALYTLLIIRILIKHGKDIQDKKRKAIIIAILGETLVAIYQAIYPTALVTCLGIVLLNLGFYLTVENPDAVLVELLEEETRRADIANQAKTKFLANMSHEIRTPINAVLGMNEMILRESKESTIRDYAKDVSGAAKSLLSIINDILDITKIEAGKLTIMTEEYSFSSMIHDVTNMISFKAKAKNLEFKVNIDEKIPSRLQGDDVRIRQILVNLLNNAVKYTHEGSIELNTELVQSEQEKMAWISFSIKDTGIGIKEEDISKLYIPFERIEEKRNRNIEGTGLGMSITVKLLDMLGSKLVVKSEYGKGSEFTFVLCQEIVDSIPIGNLSEQIEEKNAEQEYHITYQAPDARILVVDDNEMNRRVFCSLLKSTKIQIEEATGGYECIEKVKNTSYDIIFMDHMMPGLDGIETFHVMRSMNEYPCKNTPVVILTANAIVGAKEQYLQEGFEAFLSKPIDFRKLEQIIEKLLDKELVHYMDSEAKQLPECDEEDFTELPMVEGLDWEYAAIHFKDKTDMLDTVRFFVSTIDYDAKELEDYFIRIHTEEGIRSFRIKVHGMKNSASTIGIIPLAGMAKLLEDAARNHAHEVLREMTPYFLKCWKSYKEHMQMFLKKQTNRKNAAEHMEIITEIYRQIYQAAEEMDIDELDELLRQLEEYQFEGEMEEKYERIRKAIINFDVDSLQQESENEVQV